MKFDFSQFHPLDHRLISLRCLRLPGGWPRHVVLWWKYMGPGYHEEDWEPVEDPWKEKRHGPQDDPPRDERSDAG